MSPCGLELQDQALREGFGNQDVWEWPPQLGSLEFTVLNGAAPHQVDIYFIIVFVR